MGRGAMESMGRFHYGFAKRGMGMHGQGQVRHMGPHFDDKDTFRYQFTGVATDDSHT